jgi:hypothetical protein
MLIGTMIVLHVAVSGTIPSGGDGGNWLALARESLGEQVMAADVVYEPGFIGLLASLLGMLEPVSALLVAAFTAEVLLVAAVYMVTSPAGRVPALVSAVLVGAAGYRLEAYAWGAYPQMLAIGIGLLTVWTLARFISQGRWQWLALAATGLLATLATHKLVGGLMLMAIPAASLYTVWHGRFRGGWKRAGLAVLVAGVIGSFFVVTWLGASAQGVEPTLNPLGLSRLEQLLLVYKEATVPWVAVGVISAIGFVRRSWSPGVVPFVSAAFGWVLASVVGFAVLAEPRVLIQAQVAMLPMAVLVIWRWWRERGPAIGWRRLLLIAASVLAVGIFGSVMLTGLHRYDLAADWYRVVGQRELESLGELRDVADAGDTAIASRGPNGNPIGWWVQGYAGIPTLTSIDTAFLAFPDERVQAELAADLFSAPREEAVRMMAEDGVRFLILDRRGSDVGWLGGDEPDHLATLSDGTLRIMEVPDGP